MIGRVMVPLAAVAAVAGCWTFNETEYPAEGTTAAATNLSVAVIGYKATFTDYEPVTGYSSVYVPGWYGYRYYHPGHFETVASTAYVPLRRESDAYLVRAKERFEGAGFVVGASVPKVAVEVQFAGPFDSDGDLGRALLWSVGTIFFCDYSSQRWTAKLTIRDNTDGRLLLRREFEQKYEANVFSIIPIFGPASCDKTGSAAMQCWCLSALTDRTVAAATAFLAGVK